MNTSKTLWCKYCTSTYLQHWPQHQVSCGAPNDSRLGFLEISLKTNGINIFYQKPDHSRVNIWFSILNALSCFYLGRKIDRSELSLFSLKEEIGVGFMVLMDGWILTVVMRCKGQLFVVFIQVKDSLYRLKWVLEQIQGENYMWVRSLLFN